jgi:hypothetical protein
LPFFAITTPPFYHFYNKKCCKVGGFSTLAAHKTICNIILHKKFAGNNKLPARNFCTAYTIKGQLVFVKYEMIGFMSDM